MVIASQYIRARRSVAAFDVDIYMETGTGDDDSQDDTEVLMEGMSKVVTASEGDLLLINFDCDAYYIDYGVYSVKRCKFRVKVEGTAIGPLALQHFYYLRRENVAMSRKYEVPSDGDYTVTVTWEAIFTHAADEDIRCEDGHRTLTITHFKG